MHSVLAHQFLVVRHWLNDFTHFWKIQIIHLSFLYLGGRIAVHEILEFRGYAFHRFSDVLKAVLEEQVVATVR